jgi:hypothetical protein
VQRREVLAHYSKYDWGPIYIKYQRDKASTVYTYKKNIFNSMFNMIKNVSLDIFLSEQVI